MFAPWNSYLFPTCQARVVRFYQSCSLLLVLFLLFLLLHHLCQIWQLAFYLANLLTFYLANILANILALYLAYLLAFYLAYLLAFYLAYLLAFYLAYLLAFYLAYLLTFYLTCYLAFYLAYLLAFYLAVEVQRCALSSAGPRLRSSGAHWARKVPGWGPAVRTELGRSQVEVHWCALSWEGPRLRSSSAHWAGKVPGWGPAVRTELGSWRRAWRRVGKAEVEVEVDAGTWSRRNWRRRRRRRRRTTALIKSNNPHLAGGEKTVPMLYRQKMCQTPFRYVWLPEVPEGTPFGGSMSIFSAIHTVAWDQSVVLRIAFLELRESETSVFTSASEQGSLECWPWELEANWLHPTPFL